MNLGTGTVRNIILFSSFHHLFFISSSLAIWAFLLIAYKPRRERLYKMRKWQTCKTELLSTVEGKVFQHNSMHPNIHNLGNKKK